MIICALLLTISSLAWWRLIKLNNRTIVIVGIYRPPNGNVESFTNILLLLLNDPNLEKSEVIVIGDININMIGYENVDSRCKNFVHNIVCSQFPSCDN